MNEMFHYVYILIELSFKNIFGDVVPRIPFYSRGHCSRNLKNKIK